MYTNQDHRIKSEIVIDITPIYSDEYINFWSDVWLREQLNDEGILLTSFLRFPYDLLGAVHRKRASGFKPLLSKQKQVQQREVRKELNKEVTLVLNRVSSSDEEAALGTEADVSHVVLQFNNRGTCYVNRK